MIREIKEEGRLAECAAVIRESFATVAEEFGLTVENAPRFTAFAVTEDRLRYQLNYENRHMYAFFDREKILGYYSVLVGDGGVCELNNLCVIPAHRHEGIGERLLRDAFRAAGDLGCRRMNIGIVEENRVLRKWYESFGFIHTCVKKFDFFPFTCGYMEKPL